jgi:hypothetical protein
LENYNLLNKISLEDLVNCWSKQDIRDTKKIYAEPKATPESTQKCQDLIQLLQKNLTNLQSYRVDFRKSKQGFNIIIGKTNNSWLGLSSLLPAIKEKLITSDIKDTSQIPSEILPLIEEIKAIALNFKPSVRYSYNELGKGIIWKVAANKELLTEKLLKTANFIKVKTSGDRNNSGYSSVNSFLTTYLTNLQTYTLGEYFLYYYEIYTVGQTPVKDWIIFNTQVSSAP